MLSAIRPIIVWLGTAGKFIGEFCEKVAETEKQSGYWLNGLGVLANEYFFTRFWGGLINYGWNKSSGKTIQQNDYVYAEMFFNTKIRVCFDTLEFV